MAVTNTRKDPNYQQYQDAYIETFRKTSGTEAGFDFMGAYSEMLKGMKAENDLYQATPTNASGQTAEAEAEVYEEPKKKRRLNTKRSTLNRKHVSVVNTGLKG